MPCVRAGERVLSLLETTDSHFLALAPHTAAVLNDVLQQLGWRRSAQLFVPVFPVDTGASAAASRQGFVLQGLLEAHRQPPCVSDSCQAWFHYSLAGWRGCIDGRCPAAGLCAADPDRCLQAAILCRWFKPSCGTITALTGQGYYLRHLTHCCNAGACDAATITTWRTGIYIVGLQGQHCCPESSSDCVARMPL